MREFMEEEDLPQTPLPEVCSMLRTKTAFGALSNVHPWQHGDSSTAVYWCLGTMATVGPDESYAHPHNCCAGRECFKQVE